MQSGDTLETDTTEVTADTTEILVIYDIPEIIPYDHTADNTQAVLLRIQSITPNLMTITADDALFYSPLTIIDYGMAIPPAVMIPGLSRKHTYVRFNNHLLNDPITGSINFHLIPVQFARSIQTGVDGFGNTVIDVNGEENVYDRPYSTTGFLTGSFGHTAYVFELTRAIDNDLGFYLDGLYREADGYRANDEFTTMALYANVYDDHLVPMRVDALVSSHSFGFPDNTPDTMSYTDQRLIDISYTTGSFDRNAFVFFTNYSDTWHDSIDQRTITQTSYTYGLGSDNIHTFDHFQFLYRIIGYYKEITSDIYGSHSSYSATAAQTINAEYRRFFASVSINEELNEDDFQYTPFLTSGIRISDSIVTFASVARHHRTPLISEIAPLIDSTSGAVLTDDSLLTECYWDQKLGIHMPYGSITLFRHDFKDRIVVMRDSLDQALFTNDPAWQNTGIQGALHIPVYLRRGIDSTMYTRCTFNAYGSYAMKQDTLIPHPRYTIRGVISFARYTERFGLMFGTCSELVGTRYTLSDQLQDQYTIFGVFGMVRFATLSIAARCNNILDTDHEYYPEYPLTPRSFTINAQWRFWY